MKKILISTSSFGVESSYPLDLLKENGYEVLLNPFGRKLSKQETIELLQSMDGVIAGTEGYTREVLEKLPFLKVISRCGAGTDGIDKTFLNEKNITLLNTPDVHITAVAELTLAGLLSLSRRVAQGHKLLTQGRWEKIMGTNISGKTIGIVGYGRVGRLFGALMKGFNCDILVYDPYCQEELSPPIQKTNLLEDLLQQSDVISLHIPATEETKNILSSAAFSKMKKDVMIVNTSRGGLVDEEALYNFLTQNPLAGACLDVFDKEPYEGHLTELSNIVLTPHVGTFTRETRVQMELQSAQNIINYFSKNG